MVYHSTARFVSGAQSATTIIHSMRPTDKESRKILTLNGGGGDHETMIRAHSRTNLGPQRNRAIDAPQTRHIYIYTSHPHTIFER